MTTSKVESSKEANGMTGAVGDWRIGKASRPSNTSSRKDDQASGGPAITAAIGCRVSAASEDAVAQRRRYLAASP